MAEQAGQELGGESVLRLTNQVGFLGEEALERVLKAGLNLNVCSEWGEGFPGSECGREKFSQTVIRK